MKILEPILASQVESHEQFTVLTNPNTTNEFASTLEKLVILIMGKEKSLDINPYHLLMESDNNQCLVGIDVTNDQGQLIPQDFWHILRTKIGLIKRNIIDPVIDGGDADPNWRQNIGMSFKQINDLRDLTKPLSRFLSAKQVFSESSDDDFGKIPEDILEHLPTEESSTEDNLELRDVEATSIKKKTRKVTFTLLKPKKNEQQSYEVTMGPSEFDKFYKEDCCLKLYNIVINGRKKITGKITNCTCVSYRDSDSRIVFDNAGLAQLVNKNQMPLIQKNTLN